MPVLVWCLLVLGISFFKFSFHFILHCLSFFCHGLCCNTNIWTSWQTNQVHCVPRRCHIYHEERWFPNGAVNNTIVSKFWLRQRMVPLLWLVSTYASNQITQSLVCHLYLIICLWVCGRATIQWSVKHFPQSHPKMAKKLHITIRSNRLGHTMQVNYLPKEQSSHMWCVWCLLARNKMSHLGKPVDDHKDRIYPSLGTRET